MSALDFSPGRVTARIDQSIRDDEAHIKFTLKDGSVLEKHIDHAIGSISHPMSDADLETVGQAPPAADQVLRLATLARNCGLDGVVCSAHEIGRLRAALGPGFLLVVPGIRPAGAALGDQKRVMGPAAAMQAGASHLVIGRPITAAPDPETAARDIAVSLGLSGA